MIIDDVFFSLGVKIQRFSLWKQIELFQGTKDVVVAKIGEKEADKFFQQARYVVALGSNDFINNYLMPLYSDSWKYNDQTFVDYLMETLDSQLRVSRLIKTLKLHLISLVFFIKRSLIDTYSLM